MQDDTGLERPSLRSRVFLIRLDLVGSDGEAIHQVLLSRDSIGGGMMMQSCKNVRTVRTSRCYFFWPVLIFGKSTRKTGENTRKQAKTRENRRKTGAFLVLIFLGEKLVGANFYAFCNYALSQCNTRITLSVHWQLLRIFQNQLALIWKQFCVTFLLTVQLNC